MKKRVQMLPRYNVAGRQKIDLNLWQIVWFLEWSHRKSDQNN